MCVCVRACVCSSLCQSWSVAEQRSMCGVKAYERGKKEMKSSFLCAFKKNQVKSLLSNPDNVSHYTIHMFENMSRVAAQTTPRPSPFKPRVFSRHFLIQFVSPPSGKRHLTHLHLPPDKTTVVVPWSAVGLTRRGGSSNRLTQFAEWSPPRGNDRDREMDGGGDSLIGPLAGHQRAPCLPGELPDLAVQLTLGSGL